MREKIYRLVETTAENRPRGARAYDILMIVAVIASLLPLCFKTDTLALIVVDRVTVTLFIIDYLLRLITADYLIGKHSAISFLRYPIRPMAIVDLLSILPSFTPINSAFKLFRVFRLFRLLRMLKFIRYSKSLRIIINVIVKKRNQLITVGVLAVAYILIISLIILQVEPDTFSNFFEAIYWSTISLTTVGYGDLYPVTAVGRSISMLSSFVGIAIVALPSGIIVAGYQEELEDERKETAEQTED